MQFLASTTSLACATCTAVQLTLTNGTQIGEMPIASAITTNSSGCSALTVTCDASPVTGAVVLMTVSYKFNKLFKRVSSKFFKDLLSINSLV